jgi:acetate kinase
VRVLSVNCGSSTLKWALVDIEPGRDGARAAEGVVRRIGGPGEVEFRAGEDGLRRAVGVPDHGAAVRLMFGWLEELGLRDGVEAVGHRVVHGGGRFSAPARVEAEVVRAIEDVSLLAPLHNGPAVEAIRAVDEALGSGVPAVATFDTAFHTTMPPAAASYAIEPELAERHGVRRYGFHGLAHSYMAERCAAARGVAPHELDAVTLQLGNGCSATAVRGGRSVDTSMGFTPLEGLVMGTRSGDVDPSLAGHLARREGVGIEEVEGWLNRRSGLLGVSGETGDMGELLRLAAAGHERAALALEMFCHRVRKYVAAYLAVIGGGHAVAFGGGIGERGAEVRRRVCERLGWAGLALDPARNAAPEGDVAPIHADGARLGAYVVRVDEELVIARDALACLGAAP